MAGRPPLTFLGIFAFFRHLGGWDHWLSHGGGIVEQMPYSVIGEQIGLLVEEKQAAYGDSFGRSGDVLRILYPKGIGTDQIDDALCIVRIVDKLFRIATDRDALGESPYRDIAGYGILGAFRSELRR